MINSSFAHFFDKFYASTVIISTHSNVALYVHFVPDHFAKLLRPPPLRAHLSSTVVRDLLPFSQRDTIWSSRYVFAHVRNTTFCFQNHVFIRLFGTSLTIRVSLDSNIMRTTADKTEAAYIASRTATHDLCTQSRHGHSGDHSPRDETLATRHGHVVGAGNGGDGLCRHLEQANQRL